MRLNRIAVGALLLAFMAAPAVPTLAQSTDTQSWSQLGGTTWHSFYSADPAITASNAGSMGVKWMANLFSTDLGSPIVGYNSKLQKYVVYVGNERGDVIAVDAGNGQVLWSTNVGYQDKIRATPVFDPTDNSVWVGTNFAATLYKLDGSTGAVQCSVKSLSSLPIMGSPMIVTPAGGTRTVFWASIDGNPPDAGPTVATNESNCATIWSFKNYVHHEGGVPFAGPWATPAYAVSATGEPLVVIGTADVDSTEYALDANTGALVWYYSVYNPNDYDIGDAVDLSVPGRNGFADGVAYVDSKYAIEYALDLTTGKLLWQYNMYPANWSGLRNSISSAALDGNQLVMGYILGVNDLNATTGALNWTYPTPAEVASSPAIAGPPGNEVVAFADYTGAVRLLSLASGTPLYAYHTGGYITASPAVSNGTIYEASSDGFLYAFTNNGGNGARPTTQITGPANATTVPNPDGGLTITGSSADQRGVNSVEIAVQQGGLSGPWYNAATGTWGPGPWRNQATLVGAGGTSPTWSFTLPVPAGGGSYEVYANSVNTANLVDPGATLSFTVAPSTNEPTLKVSSPYVAPGGSFTSSGNAFKPGEQVTFTLFGTTVGTATVGTTGNVPQTPIVVPDTATFGPTSLLASGQTSGKQSSAPFTVSNDWTQYGYSAARTGTEPHDPIIATTIDVGSNTVLAKSWVYATGAPVNTSPAVVKGMVYVGNDAGKLIALSTASGAMMWQYAIPSGMPIRSSPAIDPNGTVIFGANDGNLYFVGPTGNLSRTLTLGGKIGNPAVNNGNIMVASDSGTLYSISDATGAIQWTASSGAAIHSSPSYDAKSGLVIVGDDSGNVTAYNSGTGAQRWRVTTGGPVTGAAAIYNGSVYVGSNDSKLYALKEATGAAEWTFVADGAIGSVASVGGASNIVFGTAAGSVYQVTPGGAQLFHQRGKYGNTPITGLASVEENAVGVTSGGVIGLTREVGMEALAPWSYQTGAGIASSPAIINGTVYLGAGDGSVYTFTPNGATPQSIARAGSTIVKITSGWTCTTQP